MRAIIIRGGLAGQSLALKLFASGVPATVRLYQSEPHLKTLGVGRSLFPMPRVS